MRQVAPRLGGGIVRGLEEGFSGQNRGSHGALPLRSEEFDGHVNELLCKLIAYNLVVCARQMRMRGVVPDFPSEIPLLEDVVRRMVEVPVLRAA